MNKKNEGRHPYFEGRNRLCEAIFLKSPHPIIISDESGNITDVNPAFGSAFGYAPTDEITFSTLIAADQEPPGRFSEKTQALLQGKIQSFRLELRCRRKDGELFWGDFYVCALQNAKGKIESAITTISDITEKKEIQSAIQERDAFIRALYDKAAQAISSTDGQGRFIEVNPAFETMFGYTRKEALQLSHLDITAPAYVQQSREKAAALFRKEIEAYRLEKLYRRKDGSVFWGDLSITAIQKPDGAVQSVAVIVDITERKKAEAALQKHRDELEKRVNERTTELAQINKRLKIEIENRACAQTALKESEGRLRAIFETATDHIFIKDRSLRYTMVNPCMARLFGMSPSRIIGLTDEALFGADTFRRLRQVDKRVLAGETIEEVHSRPVRGSLMTFFDNRAPLRDDSGNITGICGISRDITERRNTEEQPGDPEHDYPSPAMQTTLLQAQTVARTETIVLLTGESGVGKDHLARVIHARSPRSGGPFYSINCGAIPHDLAESELFGHELGAFSGASRMKRGLFELAEGGTVLLNEIGELPLLLQVKLLTFLDTFTFSRVGGEKKILVDVRILAATNRNLAEEVSAGRFRNDLFYRLSIVPIRVPPLRERKEDIAIIAQEIIDKLTLELQLPYKPKIGEGTMEVLVRYPWPGNVRELKNAIERAIILSKGPKLAFDFLGPEIASKSTEAWSIAFPPYPSLNDAVVDLKSNFIRAALKQSGGRKIEAARMLGVSRYTLIRLLKKTTQM